MSALERALLAIDAEMARPFRSTTGDADRWREYRRVQDRARAEGLSLHEASVIADREAAAFAARRDEIADMLRSCLTAPASFNMGVL